MYSAVVLWIFKLYPPMKKVKWPSNQGQFSMSKGFVRFLVFFFYLFVFWLAVNLNVTQQQQLNQINCGIVFLFRNPVFQELKRNSVTRNCIFGGLIRKDDHFCMLYINGTIFKNGFAFIYILKVTNSNSLCCKKTDTTRRLNEKSISS